MAKLDTKVNFRLDFELMGWLRHEATTRRISVSDQIRLTLLDAYNARDKQKQGG